MSKRKFDPSLIQDRKPSGGLEPLDFMRPMDKQEQPAEPKPETVATPLKEMADTPSTPPSDLPMPPARRTEARVMLVCRVTPELDKRLRQFCQAHDASMQDTVTLAIDEFLERRAA